VVAVAAEQCSDPRQQLVDLERLDEVVLGAGVEALDAVGERPSCGQDQYGCSHSS
jgi:hypothetical protein